MADCDNRLWCVVPAAGLGRRFGGDIPKQHVVIGERSILGWTLRALASSQHIAGIVVVVSTDDNEWQASACDLVGVELRSAVGGAQRADSVLAGIEALPEFVANDDFILVHDAARPCVRATDIQTLIERAGHADGGLLAAPLRDTLKRADGDGFSIATEPRESRWRALTPQMFRRAELAKALANARDANVVITDEAMAMERLGYRPLLVEGRDDNIKVTTPEDRDLAAFLLGQHHAERSA